MTYRQSADGVAWQADVLSDSNGCPPLCQPFVYGRPELVRHSLFSHVQVVARTPDPDIAPA